MNEALGGKEYIVQLYRLMNVGLMAVGLLVCLAASGLATSHAKTAPARQADTTQAGTIQALASLPSIKLPYERFTLPNGLRVIVHTDRKAPLVAVHVWYHVGSKNEPKGRSGFAHLFEHLMFNGTQNYNSDPFKPLERAGATDLNGTTWFDRTNYFQTVPKTALDLALFIESERMGKLLPVINQEKLDKERGIVLNEKRQGDNQPFGLVQYRLLAGLFPKGHPYRNSPIGSVEDLNAATLDTVKTWFESYYGPNNAVLVLAGDIDVATARPLVEKWFGDIPAGPPVARLRSWTPKRTGIVREEMADRIANPRLYRAWVLPDRSTRTSTLLKLANDILTRGTSSRLAQRLIYDKPLAVSVGGSVSELEVSSTFNIVVDVRPGVDPKQVDAELDQALTEFLKTGPTADEVARAVITTHASVIGGLEKVGGFGGKATALAEGELYSDDPAFIVKQLDWMAKATPTQVHAASKAWLGDGAYALSVMPYGKPTVAGGGADRSKLPEPASFPKPSLPEVERAKLSNGIEVVLAKRRDLPLVRVAVRFDAGTASDPKDRLGLATLAANLLDEGTTTRTALQIAQEQQRLGASITAGSSLDATQVSLSTLTPNLSPALSLLADVVRNPAFRAQDVERLRQIQLTRIAQEETQPQATALRVLPPLLYGEAHPYAVPFTGSGTVDGVRAITKDDLLGFQQRWLRADSAQIFVVGDTSLAEIMPLLQRNFGDWRVPAQAKGVKILEQVMPGAKPRIILIDRPGAAQSVITAGFPLDLTGGSQRIDIEMANEVFGGSFSARLNTTLREKKNWSYGAYSFIPAALGQRPLVLLAPVQTDKTAESVAEIMRDMREVLSTAPATLEEQAQAIASTVRALPGQLETAQAVLAMLINNAVYQHPDSYLLDYADKVSALGDADFKKGMTDLVKPQALVWVIAGDRQKIEAPLRALGIAEIEVR
jgi:zinc protease